jgi:DNA invertase Pin-like site-specific DNA recombinase
MTSAFQQFKRKRDAEVRAAFKAGVPLNVIEARFSIARSTIRRALCGLVRPGGEKYRNPPSAKTIALRANVIRMREAGEKYDYIAFKLNVSTGHVGDILRMAGMTKGSRHAHK